jgi:hypothetical protein
MWLAAPAQTDTTRISDSLRTDSVRARQDILFQKPIDTVVVAPVPSLLLGQCCLQPAALLLFYQPGQPPCFTAGMGG